MDKQRNLIRIFEYALNQEETGKSFFQNSLQRKGIGAAISAFERLIKEEEKHILFIKGIMEFMYIEVETPVKVHVDNKGYIFISENPKVKRTKNIDTRYHFLRQYVRENVIEIETYK